MIGDVFLIPTDQTCQKLEVVQTLSIHGVIAYAAYSCYVHIIATCMVMLCIMYVQVLYISFISLFGTETIFRLKMIFLLLSFHHGDPHATRFHIPRCNIHHSAVCETP